MTAYTVEISARDRNLWQALEPAENVEDDGTAEDVAQWVAVNQSIAVQGTWRVRVWEGYDADTSTAPAAELERDEEA